MKTFEELHEELPFLEKGKKHSKVLEPYESVRCKFPGKYASKTKGGDFVVETDTNGKWVPLRHKDYFRDVEVKSDKDQEWVLRDFIPQYLMAIGVDVDTSLFPLRKGGYVWPEGYNYTRELGYQTSIIIQTLQLIAVAEHRRYAKYEPEGGRFLLPRFLIGIACGCWTADEANYHLKQGKPGLERLRAEKGLREPTFDEIIEIGVEL
ncbi:MAG: hypothetical protein ACQ5SW_09635 [Sphaerochaetaceae bacterium]